MLLEWTKNYSKGNQEAGEEIASGSDGERAIIDQSVV